MSKRRTSLSFSLFAFQDIITAVTGILLLITITLAIILITTEKAIPVEDRTKYHQDLQKEVAKLAEQVDAIQADLVEVKKKSEGLSRLQGEQLKREVEYVVRNVKIANSRVEELKQKKEVFGKAWSEQVSRDENMSTALKNKNSKLKQELNDIVQTLSDMRTRNQFIFNLPEDINKRAWLLQVSKGKLELAPVDGKLAPKTFGTTNDFLKTLKNYPRKKHYFVLFVKPSGVPNSEAIQAKLDLLAFDFGIDAISEDSSIVPES